MRDRRIEMSCGKDGAECGQGWYQQVLPNAKGVRGRMAIRPTCAAQRTVWATLAQSQARAVIRGEVSAVAMMDRIGMQAAGDISKAIATLTSPPLSEITIELRRRKRAGHAISGKTIGEAARATQAPGYQPGDAGAAENKPLVFSGILLATLTNTVEGA